MPFLCGMVRFHHDGELTSQIMTQGAVTRITVAQCGSGLTHAEVEEVCVSSSSKSSKMKLANAGIVYVAFGAQE